MYPLSLSFGWPWTLAYDFTCTQRESKVWKKVGMLLTQIEKEATLHNYRLYLYIDREGLNAQSSYWLN